MTTDKKSEGKAGRPSRTLDEEIAATEARLKQLREKKREDERKERERNQRAIMALLRENALDEYSASKWKEALPEIATLLSTEKGSVKEAKIGLPASPAPSATSPAAVSALV